MRAVSPRVDVAFVHIPKTGGTAIEMAAWRQARLVVVVVILVLVVVLVVVVVVVVVKASCSIVVVVFVIETHYSSHGTYGLQARLPWGIYYAGRWEFLLRESCSVRNATCARGCLQGGVNETCMDAMATEHGVTTSCPTDNPFGPRPRGDDYHVRRHCCDWWHIPPAQLTHDPRPYYAVAPHRFCVVRNPYERLLSIYMATWFSATTPEKNMCRNRFLTHNITNDWTFSLNAWVALISRGYQVVNPALWRHRPEAEWVLPARGRLGALLDKNRPKWVTPMNWSAKPLNCWVEPQSAYLAEHFSTVNDLPSLNARTRSSQPLSSSGSTSGCNIVLRYESLQADFTALMRWAQLSVKLPRRSRGARSPSPGRVNASCFDAHGARELLLPYTRSVVQQMYARDFEVLGYTP